MRAEMPAGSLDGSGLSLSFSLIGGRVTKRSSTWATS